MERHVTAEEIVQFQGRRMAPEEILRFRGHIDSCEECRAKLGATAQDAAFLRACIDGEPDEQELVLFAAGKLPAGRAAEIEEHVASCARCRDVVEDLRTFETPRALIAMPARKRPVPLWWGAVAALLLVGVYAVSQSLKPPVIAQVRDGGSRIELTRSGQVNGIRGLDDQERLLIAAALRTGRLPLQAQAAGPDAGILRGEQDKQPFHLMEPLRTRVLSDRPVFRWEPLDRASSYQVTVFTEDEKVVDQGTVSETFWKPALPLPRGGRLYWQVTALHPDRQITAPAPPAPRAWFEIVSTDVAARLASNSGSALRMAVAYAQEGLQAEALHEMSQLIAENPDSTLVRQLRDSLLVK